MWEESLETGTSSGKKGKLKRPNPAKIGKKINYFRLCELSVIRMVLQRIFSATRQPQKNHPNVNHPNVNHPCAVSQCCICLCIIVLLKFTLILFAKQYQRRTYKGYKQGRDFSLLTERGRKLWTSPNLLTSSSAGRSTFWICDPPGMCQSCSHLSSLLPVLCLDPCLLLSLASGHLIKAPSIRFMLRALRRKVSKRTLSIHNPYKALMPFCHHKPAYVSCNIIANLT